MITGCHLILFAQDAEAARSFFRDVLELPSVDSGGGWLIFALPPAELAAHPTEGQISHELYLMCDDIASTVSELTRKGVEFTDEISEHDWGSSIPMKVPGAGVLRLYEPKHLSPLRTRDARAT
jgi:catechol 2,3-dioxygenase-like lactoylglutathione lyase family enzyme